MQFESHYAIAFFWILPVLLVLFLLLEKKRKRILHGFSPPDVLAKRLPDYAKGTYVVRFLFFVLAIFCLGLAWLKPYSDYEMREVKRKGVDLFFLVDLSQSMNAQDIQPSRITRARYEIVDFLKNLHGDRVGLIGFAGDSFVFVPLTGDYNAFSMFVDELTPEAMPVQGTDIKGAIAKAVKSFQKTSSSRAVVLITDGEDTVGLNQDVLEQIRELNIKLYIMGVGSEEGAPIPLSEGGYLKDRKDQVVLSRLNEPALQQLAKVTGGGYVRSVSGDLDLEQIYQQGIKKSFEDVALNAGQKKLPVYEFQGPILAAIILLFLEILTTNKKRFWRGLWPLRARQKTVPTNKMGILIFLLVCPVLMMVSQSALAMNPFTFEKANHQHEAEAYDKARETYSDLSKKNPSDAELHYNMGANDYRLNDFTRAEENYTKALDNQDNNMRSKTLFNLGNVRYKQKDMKGALEYYEKALQVNPDYEAAKLNREYVKKVMEGEKNEGTKDENTRDEGEKNEETKDENTKDEGEKNEGTKDENTKDEGEKNEETKDENTRDEGEKNEGTKDENTRDEGEKNEGTKDENTINDPYPLGHKRSTPHEEYEFDKNPQGLLEQTSDEPRDALRYMIKQQTNEDKEVERPW